MMLKSAIYILLSFFTTADAFLTPASALIRSKNLVSESPSSNFNTYPHQTVSSKSLSLSLVPEVNSFDNSILISTESWRQYVPLVVSILVIIDILLGSPAANLVMKPLRQAQQDTDDGGNIDGNLMSMFEQEQKKKRERVDVDEIAQAALEKAQNSKELRDYLERNKSEKDKMDDIRRKIDAQIRDMEANE